MKNLIYIRNKKIIIFIVKRKGILYHDPEHYEKIKDLNIEYVAKDLEDAVAWMEQHFDMNN